MAEDTKPQFTEEEIKKGLEHDYSKGPELRASGKSETGEFLSGKAGETGTPLKFASRFASIFFGGVGETLEKKARGEKLGGGEAFSSALDVTGLGAPATLGVGAIRGVRRMPRLFHGTQKEFYPSIIEEGFSRGRSAELMLKGTSTTRDPLISYLGFSDASTKADVPDTILEAILDYDVKDIRNLRPSEYLIGAEKLNLDTDLIYNKPNIFFAEAETFALRKDGFENINIDIDRAATALYIESPDLFSSPRKAKEELKHLTKEETFNYLTSYAPRMAREYTAQLKPTTRIKPAPLSPEALKQVQRDVDTYYKYQEAFENSYASNFLFPRRSFDEFGGVVEGELRYGAADLSPSEFRYDFSRYIRSLNNLRGNRGQFERGYFQFASSFQKIMDKAIRSSDTQGADEIMSTFYQAFKPSDPRRKRAALTTIDKFFRHLEESIKLRSTAHDYDNLKTLHYDYKLTKEDLKDLQEAFERNASKLRKANPDSLASKLSASESRVTELEKKYQAAEPGSTEQLFHESNLKVAKTELSRLQNQYTEAIGDQRYLKDLKREISSTEIRVKKREELFQKEADRIDNAVRDYQRERDSAMDELMKLIDGKY